MAFRVSVGHFFFFSESASWFSQGGPLETAGEGLVAAAAAWHVVSASDKVG